MTAPRINTSTKYKVKRRPSPRKLSEAILRGVRFKKYKATVVYFKGWNAACCLGCAYYSETLRAHGTLAGITNALQDYWPVLREPASKFFNDIPPDKKILEGYEYPLLHHLAWLNDNRHTREDIAAMLITIGL